MDKIKEMGIKIPVPLTILQVKTFELAQGFFEAGDSSKYLLSIAAKYKLKGSGIF